MNGRRPTTLVPAMFEATASAPDCRGKDRPCGRLPEPSTWETVVTGGAALDVLAAVHLPNVKGQLDFPVGGQLISLLADSLFPCPRSADLLLI